MAEYIIYTYSFIMRWELCLVYWFQSLICFPLYSLNHGNYIHWTRSTAVFVNSLVVFYVYIFEKCIWGKRVFLIRVGFVFSLFKNFLIQEVSVFDFILIHHIHNSMLLFFFLVKSKMIFHFNFGILKKNFGNWLIPD